MSVREVKRFFKEVVERYSEWDPYELRRIFTEAIREREMELGWSDTDTGEAWTDDEIRAVLSTAWGAHE